MFWTWALLGALIGIVAANRRGFSPWAGGAGGALLGPLAFLLFFVTGVVRAERKCPACAEIVKAEATVCKHCKSPLAPVGR